jgi:ribosomal protein S18 acetylase RimI-like enzyme
MSQLKIRKASTEDATAITRLVNAAYRPELGAQGWTHESHIVSGERTNAVQVASALEKSTVLVGLYGTEIVACVQIERDGIDAYIGMLAVDPMRQATGLGKVMLSQAESYAETSLGAQRFALIVVKARTELVQFYLRRGYDDTGKSLPYPIDSGVGTPRSDNLELIVLRKRSNSSVNPDTAEDRAGYLQR